MSLAGLSALPSNEELAFRVLSSDHHLRSILAALDSPALHEYILEHTSKLHPGLDKTLIQDDEYTHQGFGLWSCLGLEYTELSVAYQEYKMAFISPEIELCPSRAVCSIDAQLAP
jgi:prenyltransferase beta subunit